MFNKTLSYNDVLLVPQYSDIKSRKEVDVSSQLGEIKFDLPIISSPMDTISEGPMAAAMSNAGGLAIIHRYNTPEEQAQWVHNVTSMIPPTIVGGAIGTSGDYLERAGALVAAGAKVICVDVAHGHHVLMKTALRALRIAFGDKIHIMAGNVATLEGYNDLVDWGANSVRCNIGGGSICSTRIQTGHGIPGFHTIVDCARSDRNVPIIADGGIRNSGDIVKALAAGADFVMLGSLLSGTDETPGDIINTRKGKFKAYRGMASKDAQVEWRGRTASLEGIATTVPYKGAVQPVLDDLVRGIRSGFSYSGARTLSELQAKAQFVYQTMSGQSESGTHILR
jgi:IMP dehydrogenase